MDIFQKWQLDVILAHYVKPTPSTNSSLAWMPFWIIQKQSIIEMRQAKKPQGYVRQRLSMGVSLAMKKKKKLENGVDANENETDADLS